MKTRYVAIPITMLVLAVLALAAFSTPASAGCYGYGCPKVTTEPYHNDFYQWYNGTIHGGIYFQLNGSYSQSEGETQTYVFHDVPDGRRIARYYYGIWLGSRSNKTIVANISTNGNYTNITYEDHSCPEHHIPTDSDQDCPICQQVCVKENPVDPDATADITGCGVSPVITNVTAYSHLNTGENTIVWHSGEQPYQFALMVLYENNSMPFNQYWIKEGHEYPDAPPSADKTYPLITYFNETVNTGRIYPGSIQSVTFMTNGYPHCLGGYKESGYPTLNGNELDAPDYVYSYDVGGDVYEGPGESNDKEYTVFARWDNISTDYITRPSNRIDYPTLKDNDRLMVPILMLKYYEPSNLTVTDISPESLCVNHWNVINATVVSYGPTAKYFNVTLYANSTKVDVEKVTNLSQGESKVVRFLWKPTSATGYTLNVTADVENVVNETDETNNSKTLSVEVTIAPPPAWQSQSSNVSAIPNGGSIELRAQGNATAGLDYAVLCTNETGTWVNHTNIYGSPKDLDSYISHSTTHTSNADWKAQAELDNVSVVGDDVKLYRMVGTTNIALNQPAYAENSHSDHPPSNAVDGDSGTKWHSTVMPNWWKVDLGEATDIEKISFDLEDYGAPYKYNISISNDNNTWTTKIEKSVGNDDTFTDLQWSCRYIKMNLIDALGDYDVAGIYEFKAYEPGDYKLNGTLTSKTVETELPIASVTPIWNVTNSTNTSISVNVSVDGGATWTSATNDTELTWDAYDDQHTRLKYRVSFNSTNVNETPVLHDITLNYTTEDPVESEWLWSNFTWHNASVINKTVSWKIYYEDMLGKENCTGVKTFRVGEGVPNVVVKVHNTSFGNMLAGDNTTIHISLTLNNSEGTAAATIEAVFKTNVSEIYGLNGTFGSNIIPGNYFKLGPDGNETALTNSTTKTFISTVAAGVIVDYDAILTVPAGQAADDYSGIVELSW